MNFFKALIGGVIGGALGATVWAFISSGTGYEVGWIAWGIGVAVGIGVAWGNQGGESGAPSGALAAVVAIVAVLGGKFAAVQLDLQEFLDSDELVISCIADVIVAEHEEAGRRVRMPPPMAAESLEEEYPRSIWADANRRWLGLSPEEQEELRRAPEFANPHFVLSTIADEIAMERENAGRAVQWPEGMTFAEAWRQPDYAEELWSEAVGRWEAWTPSQQAEYEEQLRASVAAEWDAISRLMRTQIGGEAFLDSFSLFDALWLVLAVGSAYQIAASGRFSGAEV